MNKHRLLCLVAAGVMVGCSKGSVPNASPNISPNTLPNASSAFAVPIANQVQIHAHSAEPIDGHTHLDVAQVSEQIEVALVPSELTVGANRFAVGLFDAAGDMVRDAEVHFHYFDLSDTQAPLLESHAEAARLQTPDGTTIFAQERDFGRAGPWGVEVQAQFADGRTAVKRIRFTVLAESPTLKPGEVVPAIDTPTAAGVDNDLARLTSAPEPNPAFYQVSLDQALASGRPTVLLFATPAFCQTRFCGSDYEIVGDLQARYHAVFNFIHVEVYTGLPDPAANQWQIAPAMVAFGLSTEPWVYLLDQNGTVAYRVEGMVSPEELERHLQAIRQGP